jgi:hypothetical protein
LIDRPSTIIELRQPIVGIAHVHAYAGSGRYFEAYRKASLFPLKPLFMRGDYATAVSLR